MQSITNSLPLSPAELTKLFEDAIEEAEKRKADERAAIWQRCSDDSLYFISEYCKIYDNVAQDWIPFELWDFQKQVILDLIQYPLISCIKSRQVGLTWDVLAYILYKSLFAPIQDVLMFSRREDEAIHLLDERLKGMYEHLPRWMQDKVTMRSNKTHMSFSNGSTIRAFPTGVGDTYTATIAFIDEADLAPDVGKTITSTKPTVEAGGQMILLGRVDKRRQDTPHKQIFKDAQLGKNGYHPIFIPWHAHPKRNQAWYERITREALSIDEVHEQYPATPQEALARGSVGLVFPNFSHEENVTVDADYDPNYPVEWWCDYGFTNPSAMLFVQKRHFRGMNDHICIFDEIYLTHQTHEQLIRLAAAKGYALPETIWYDSAEAVWGTHFRNFRDSGLPDLGIGSFICSVNGAVKGANSIANGIKVMRYFIGANAQGFRLLRYHPRVKNTIRETSEYSEREKGALSGGDLKPIDENNHTVDCQRYGLQPYMYRIETLE